MLPSELHSIAHSTKTSVWLDIGGCFTTQDMLWNSLLLDTWFVQQNVTKRVTTHGQNLVHSVTGHRTSHYRLKRFWWILAPTPLSMNTQAASQNGEHFVPDLTRLLACTIPASKVVIDYLQIRVWKKDSHQENSCKHTWHHMLQGCDEPPWESTIWWIQHKPH